MPVGQTVVTDSKIVELRREAESNCRHPGFSDLTGRGSSMFAVVCDRAEITVTSALEKN